MRYLNNIFYFLKYTDEYVIDTHNRNAKPLAEILYFEPYMRLQSGTLQKIFDEGKQNDDLDVALLHDFSLDYQGYAKFFQEMLLEGYRG